MGHIRGMRYSIPDILGAVVALIFCTLMVRLLDRQSDDWGVPALVLVCGAIVALCLLIGRWWDKRQQVESERSPD